MHRLDRQRVLNLVVVHLLELVRHACVLLVPEGVLAEGVQSVRAAELAVVLVYDTRIWRR